MQQITLKQKIQSPCDVVRKLIWSIQNWSDFWFPLYRVKVLYDDGFHQDFAMYLQWQEEETRIRTIRFLNQKGDILFFSPQPPPPTTVHHGIWQFSPSGSCTELIATRWFEFPKQEKEPENEYLDRLSKFSNDFQKRLVLLLQKLGDICEKSIS